MILQIVLHSTLKGLRGRLDIVLIIAIYLYDNFMEDSRKAS